ncbi:hypothetical protein MKEN_01407500 [Mycena kentingensis (nom. inval.)]|nr:hypothetical protein MKEN_01407500 [Mycena kentingensis (nom. inval.)]
MSAATQRLQLLPWNEKLTLPYMRAHQPWTNLPEEYFLCSGQSPYLPDFVYGFPIRFAETDDPDHLLDHLKAMQKKIPHPDFSDPDKYGAVAAICAYIYSQVEIEGGIPEFVPTTVDADMDILSVVCIHSSHAAQSPEQPLWVQDVVEIAKEILGELGWTDVPEPKWYIGSSTLACKGNEDYNVPPVSGPPPYLY